MEYDFYTMGMRYGKEKLVDLKQTAESIGKKYGEDAKMEFELGIAVSIPVYANYKSSELTIDDIEHSNSKFGMPNERNNSYFGGIGTSHQFIEKNDGGMIYNEPSVKSR